MKTSFESNINPGIEDYTKWNGNNAETREKRISKFEDQLYANTLWRRKKAIK